MADISKVTVNGTTYDLKDAVAREALSKINSFDREIVDSLPTTDISKTKLYLVPKTDSETKNVYDEYINTTGDSDGWELIGNTEIDMSGYVKEADLGDYLKKDGSVVADKLQIGTLADGTSSSTNTFAQGLGVTVSSNYAHAEGFRTKATADYAHAEGNWSEASGYYSHAEGGSKASGVKSHAEGDNSEASSEGSHVEGFRTKATANYAHAEGGNGTASNLYAHSEGSNATASGHASHAEGQSTKASSTVSHAEGNRTTASGAYSHAEGTDTTASGEASHAGGIGTTAAQKYQYVSGKYNDNKTDTLFEIGNGYNGASGPVPSNAFEVTTDGFIRTHNNDTKIAFGKNDNGDYGYFNGAGEFSPFKSDSSSGPDMYISGETLVFGKAPNPTSFLLNVDNAISVPDIEYIDGDGKIVILYGTDIDTTTGSAQFDIQSIRPNTTVKIKSLKGASTIWKYEDGTTIGTGEYLSFVLPEYDQIGCTGYIQDSDEGLTRSIGLGGDASSYTAANFTVS